MLNRPLPAPARDIAMLIARVILGVVLFAHGWQKLMINGISETYGQFEKLGIPLAIVSASFTSFVEFVGGVLIILGALTTTVVALDLIVMVGAAGFVHVTNGIFAKDGGWELVGVIVAVELALAAFGPGCFSVDHLIARRRDRERADLDRRRHKPVRRPVAVSEAFTPAVDVQAGAFAAAAPMPNGTPTGGFAAVASASAPTGAFAAVAPMTSRISTGGFAAVSANAPTGAFAAVTPVSARVSTGGFAAVSASAPTGAFAAVTPAAARASTDASAAEAPATPSSLTGAFAAGATASYSGSPGAFAPEAPVTSSGSTGAFAAGAPAAPSGSTGAFAVGAPATSSGSTGVFAVGAPTAPSAPTSAMPTVAPATADAFAASAPATPSGSAAAFAAAGAPAEAPATETPATDVLAVVPPAVAAAEERGDAEPVAVVAKVRATREPSPRMASAGVHRAMSERAGRSDHETPAPFGVTVQSPLDFTPTTAMPVVPPMSVETDTITVATSVPGGLPRRVRAADLPPASAVRPYA